MLKSGENCGGPMICRNCAMKWAQKYYDAGKKVWCRKFIDHRRKLYSGLGNRQLCYGI